MTDFIQRREINAFHIRFDLVIAERVTRLRNQADTFDATYATPEHAARPVAYASRQELFLSISKRYSSSDRPVQAQQALTTQRRAPRSAMGLYSEDTRP